MAGKGDPQGMVDAVKVAVRQRTVLGKKAESLRRRGILPGVVFGHGASLPVETDAHAFELGYRRWGSTTLLSLEGIGPDGTPALVAGISRHPLDGRILHVDFERVSLTERTHAEVPLRFVGTAGALRTGGVLVHAMDRVRVEALPQDIPHSIDVDLTRIDAVGDAVFVRDLVVDTTTVQIVDRPDALVAKAVHQRAEEVAPAPTAAAATAEGALPEEGEAPAEGTAPVAAAPAKPGAPAAKPAAAPAPAKGAPAAGSRPEKK